MLDHANSKKWGVASKGYHLTLDEIPAWVCSQCGEVYFEEPEVDAIQEVYAKEGKAAEELICVKSDFKYRHRLLVNRTDFLRNLSIESRLVYKCYFDVYNAYPNCGKNRAF